LRKRIHKTKLLKGAGLGGAENGEILDVGKKRGSGSACGIDKASKNDCCISAGRGKEGLSKGTPSRKEF